MIPNLSPRISQKPDPRDTRRLTLRIWAVLFPALWAVHYLSPLPAVRPIAVWLEGSLVAVLALGLSVLGTMVVVTRHRLRSVVRPTRANVIGGASLTLVAPLVVLGGVPLILGGILVFSIGAVARGSAGVNLGSPIADVAKLVMIVGVPAIVCYPIACILVAGTTSRWWRFALFCLIWWSAYAAHILIFNVSPFRL